MRDRIPIQKTMRCQTATSFSFRSPSRQARHFLNFFQMVGNDLCSGANTDHIDFIHADQFSFNDILLRCHNPYLNSAPRNRMVSIGNISRHRSITRAISTSPQVCLPPVCRNDNKNRKMPQIKNASTAASSTCDQLNAVNLSHIMLPFFLCLSFMQIAVNFPLGNAAVLCCLLHRVFLAHSLR